MTNASHSMPTKAAPLWQPVCVVGFGCAVALWSAWFVTHLPWLGIAETVSLPVVLGVWVLAAAWAGTLLGSDRAWKVGMLSGFVTAVLGLAVLGSKLRPTVATASAPTEEVVPNAGLIVLGFLCAGGVIGALGCFAGGLLKPLPPREEPNWLGRFAVLVAVAVAPLVFVGGLVTSTGSGLAVPDWPNTFGSNMFLYPLGPRAQAGVFLEHSHRLFGTMAGTGVLVLAVWCCLRGAGPTLRRVFVALVVLTAVVAAVLLALRSVPSHVELAFAAAVVGVLVTIGAVVKGSEPGDRRAKVWSLALLALIIVQGYLGGVRVVAQNQVLAMVHGIAAQLILAGLAILAAYLSRPYLAAQELGHVEGARRTKALATAAMHSLLLQLVFGAAYRHFGHGHVLWTHAVFALLVALAVMLAGFSAGALRTNDDAPPRTQAPLTLARLVGIAVSVVVGMQFLLGWLAFMVRGDTASAGAPVHAVIRTAHQANGALLVGLTACLFVLAREIYRRSSRATAGSPAA